MTKAEQKEMPIDAFKLRIKCCYNCPSWQKMSGKSYCFCSMRDGFVQTAWDYCCIDYGGLAKEENLLVTSKKPPKKANKKREDKSDS